jgi:hypothetical protein
VLHALLAKRAGRAGGRHALPHPYGRVLQHRQAVQDVARARHDHIGLLNGLRLWTFTRASVRPRSSLALRAAIPIVLEAC